MSDKDKETQHSKDDLDDVKSLIGDAPASSDSLDEILSEYSKKRPPIQFPVSSVSSQPSSPSAKPPSRAAGQRKPGKVVAFPGTTPLPDLSQWEQEDTTATPSEPKPPVPSPVPGPPKSRQKVVKLGSSPEPHEKKQHNQSSKGVRQTPRTPPPTESPENPTSPVHDNKVIPFPEEESVLSSFLKDLGRKADHYADHMFEEDERTDPEEVRRLEELIPGTDQEQPEPPPSRLTRPKKKIPPPPDTDPAELARAYSKGLHGMHTRAVILAFLALLSLALLFAPALGLSLPSPLNEPVLQCGLSVVLLIFGILLSFDIIGSTLFRVTQGKIGMDTLAILSCFLTLADGLYLLLFPPELPRMPYCCLSLLHLFFLLEGLYHKRCALRISCRTASAAANPYRVTLDEATWNHRDTYSKWASTAEGFGSQIQMDDGAEQVFYRFCPLLLLGAILFSLLAARKQPSLPTLIWSLSALFTASSSLGANLVYGRSFHKIARRLAQCGAALAGWPGLSASRRADRVLITDYDLFPPGQVELNGFKLLGNHSVERVVAYTATVIQESGSGLAKPFHDYLRKLGGVMRRAEQLQCYEAGGLSAIVRGDRVLVGSAAFMSLMEIDLPAGMSLKNSVFCAINGELCGLFILLYKTSPETLSPAFDALIHEHINPVLATRDFNLIPTTLHQRFKLNVERMDFPPVKRRWELSDPTQPHNEILTALLCREGLLPFAEAAIAAKRLRWATRVGTLLCCVGSLLGLLLAAYLVSVLAYGSLAPLNLFIYLISWLVPAWLLSDWVHRF